MNENGACGRVVNKAKRVRPLSKMVSGKINGLTLASTAALAAALALAMLMEMGVCTLASVMGRVSGGMIWQLTSLGRVMKNSIGIGIGIDVKRSVKRVIINTKYY